MLNLRQSTFSVAGYINNFELMQHCVLVEDPSLTIARFIQGLCTDLQTEVTFSSAYTIDEAYHKPFDVQKLDGLYHMHPCTPSKAPYQVVESSLCASNSKCPDSLIRSNPALSASASNRSSLNQTPNVSVPVVAGEVFRLLSALIPSP